VKEADIHPHLQARMRQRGVTREEIESTINSGWHTADAKQGTLGKVMVFPYEKEWEVGRKRLRRKGSDGIL